MPEQDTQRPPGALGKKVATIGAVMLAVSIILGVLGIGGSGVVNYLGFGGLGIAVVWTVPSGKVIPVSLTARPEVGALETWLVTAPRLRTVVTPSAKYRRPFSLISDSLHRGATRASEMGPQQADYLRWAGV